MLYEDFYDLAVYANENWKDNFTEREIACNAYEYLFEHEESKRLGKATRTMSELFRLLEEDGTEEAKEWIKWINRLLA